MVFVTKKEENSSEIVTGHSAADFVCLSSSQKRTPKQECNPLGWFRSYAMNPPDKYIREKVQKAK